MKSRNCGCNANSLRTLANNSSSIIDWMRHNRAKTSAIAQRDGEIIALRTAVRKAAESKLAHGIIDVNGLLREINKENAAKTQQAIHEIDMLKAMYDLKFSHNE